MNINGIKKSLPVLMKHNIVPFVWGEHGKGKTQSIKQLAKDLNIGFIALYLSTQEVGDLIGLLVKNDDGTVSHARPEWFPTEGEGILFLDEFNRAHPDVMQAMLPFALDKILHTHKLPPGWKIVCAGNYNSNSYSTTDMSDSALYSRFCHIDFQPSREEFIMFAQEKGADDIASFIRDHGNMLEAESKSEFDESKLKPNRRAYMDFIFPLEQEELNGELRFEIYKGIIGTSATAAFLTHKKTKEATLDIQKVLKKYTTDKSVRAKVLEVSGNKQDVRFDYLNQPIEELLTNLENNRNFLKEEWVPNLKQFLLDIPLELSMKTFKRMQEIKFVNRKLIINDPDFCAVMSNRMKKGA